MTDEGAEKQMREGWVMGDGWVRGFTDGILTKHKLDNRKRATLLGEGWKMAL